MQNDNTYTLKDQGTVIGLLTLNLLKPEFSCVMDKEGKAVRELST